MSRPTYSDSLRTLQRAYLRARTPREALARRRLPQWADRIWTGNAIDWEPPPGLRFDYVHLLLNCVPAGRKADLVRHHLTRTVRVPGGCLPGRPPAPSAWIDA